MRGAAQEVTAVPVSGRGPRELLLSQAELTIGRSGRYYPPANTSLIRATLSQEIQNTTGTTTVEIHVNGTSVGSVSLGVGEEVDQSVISGVLTGGTTDYITAVATSVGDGALLTLQIEVS